MKPNMGILDKLVRILFAIAVCYLYFTHQISGTFSIVLMVLAAVFVLTSAISFCPLYTIFGFSTKSK